MPLKNYALLIIDVQKGFDDPCWGKRNNPDAEKNIAKLLKVFRKKKKPIFHVKNDSVEINSPLRPNLPGNEIKDIVKPLKTETVLVKTVNSAFIGTDLEKTLKERGISVLVIVGLTTDHCVSTTARMAANLGFTVYVVSDATAAFSRKSANGKEYTAQQMHEIGLVSLEGEFAKIVETKHFL